MENKRRVFVKKALGATALVAATGAIANVTRNKNYGQSDSNGVVVGKSNKKEILYKETENWDAFYKASY